MDCEEIELHVGYFKGMLEFMDGSILHFAEFVETYELVKRLKYKYHLQSESGDLIARWDNVPHHRDISTFPHHNAEYWEFFRSDCLTVKKGNQIQRTHTEFFI